MPRARRRKVTRERALAIVVRLRLEIRRLRRLRDERLTRHVAAVEPVPDPPPVCRGRTDGGRVRGVRKV